MPCSDCTVPLASPRTVAGNGDFVKALDKHFPGTQREAPFIERCAEELKVHGFTADTCIACMGVCRDEFCDTLGYELKKHFGVPFMLRGLAGFIFCGKTGFGAAHAHSPIDSEGREKYLYVVAPHIGIMSDGTLGRVAREGRAGESTACGALCALQKAIQSGHLDTEFHMDDIEMSIMKQIIARNLEWGEQPDIIRLTHISSKCIAEQLEDMINKMVDTDKADYAVISGVQIHGPGLCQNYFMPTLDSCYAVVKGQKIQLDVGDSGIKADTK